MKWAQMLELIGGRTLFNASALLAGPDAPAEVRRQLSRWVSSGRLIQLRRGLYALAPPYARESPNPFAVAARLRRPSYVSLQSALSHHGAIPEGVFAVTSVTTGRPGRFETALGTFFYNHLKQGLFWGYRQEEAGDDFSCIALPEKALLDLYHLTPGPVSAAYVQELRLAPHALDAGRLQQFASRAGKPKLIRAAAVTSRLLEEESRGEITL